MERRDSTEVSSPLALTASDFQRIQAARATDGRSPEQLSTVELVKQITTEVGRLARKQVELVKTELKADVRAEAWAIGGLSLAALGALCTVSLLLVTVVLALAQWMAGWLAGLVVSAATLAATGLTAWLAWNRRVRSPLARTQRTLKEDVQWTKERLT